MAKVSKKRKIKRSVASGIVHIKVTYNNTIVTITDMKGDTLCWATAGTCGFKGSRKSTAFAGQMAAQQAADKAKKFGMKAVAVLRSVAVSDRVLLNACRSVFSERSEKIKLKRF